VRAIDEQLSYLAPDSSRTSLAKIAGWSEVLWPVCSQDVRARNSHVQESRGDLSEEGYLESRAGRWDAFVPGVPPV
jgi:hypothetical protein